MCDCKSDRLLLLHNAVLAADQMLERYPHLPIAKAIDIGTPAGFDRAAALLASRLRLVASKSDLDAVRNAVEALDVDWAKSTPLERNKLISQAMAAAGRASAIVASNTRVVFSETAGDLVSATRTFVRREHGLGIGAEFNALDKRVISHVVRSQGNYVRDEYGRRVDSFGGKAREIVAEGVELGLGRDDIASSLEKAAKAAFVQRAPFYWELIASAFVGQARSFGMMSSFAEAGIQRYQIEAVLDERTTQICRYLHGKTFSVGDALARFDSVERMEEPEGIKRELPWARETTDPETGLTRLYVNGVSGRVEIADVIRSAFGSRDDRGEFRVIASDEGLRRAGIGFPPYHGFCRTCVLPAS